MNFKKEIKEFLNYDISEEQEAKFEKYFNLLVGYNKITNLTAITERNDVYYKHFIDSLSSIMLVNYGEKDIRICDIGSGAGFPSIPIKILYPDIKIDIVDSLNKRISFLKVLIKELELTDVNPIHERIEVFAHSNIGKYDYITARALGKLNMISEMGLPMLKINGVFIAYKGSKIEEELSESTNAIKILGGTVIDVKKLYLPKEYGERNLILIQKIKNIKGYPRSFAVMKKRPL